jgi:hypothetical protein
MAEHGQFREEFPDEHPSTYDHTEPKGSLLFILFGLTVIIIALISIAINQYYEGIREREIYTRVLAPENDQLRNLRNTEDRELHSFGYADKTAGKVRLTIDRAMDLVAQDAKSGQVKWPTAPYQVKTAADLALNPAGVSQPGAAAAVGAQQQGTGSNPNVQQPSNQKR